jgi:hypothetical protein
MERRGSSPEVEIGADELVASVRFALPRRD